MGEGADEGVGKGTRAKAQMRAWARAMSGTGEEEVEPSMGIEATGIESGRMSRSGAG